MMRWILLFCLVTICLDVPQIDAMKCFRLRKSKRRDTNNPQSNASGSQSNASTSRLTNSSGLQPSTSGSQPFVGHRQPQITSGSQPVVGHRRPQITNGIRPSTSGSQPYVGQPQPSIPSTSRPNTSSSRPSTSFSRPSTNGSQSSNTGFSKIMAQLPRNTDRKPTPYQIAMKRLQKELRDIKKDGAENCSADLASEDNMFEWIGTINGPKKSPYEGGVFKLSLSVPDNYPNAPPKVKFLTNVYHCNINLNGSICLDILKDEGGWSPAYTIRTILLSISSLLTDPNPDDPLMGSIASEFKFNRSLHDMNARAWTIKFAKPVPEITGNNNR